MQPITVIVAMARYWYKNGALRPDMMTVFIAMDPCTKVNGGLQVQSFHVIFVLLHRAKG